MKLLNVFKIGTMILVSNFGAVTTYAQYDAPNTYVTMPVSYSPATTGLINGDIRANASRGWRWVSVLPKAMITTQVSVDMPILRNALPKGNAIGIGVMLSESNHPISSWIYNGINTTKTYGISGAYHKALDKEMNHHLSLGIQFLSSSGKIVDEPLILSTWSSNSSNIGLLYSGIVSKKLFLYGGISLKQNSLGIRSLDEGMLETSFGGNLEVSKRVGLLANFTQVFIAGFYRTQGIAYARIVLYDPIQKANNKWALYGGCGYSVDDELLPYLAIEYGGIRVGITASNTLWQYKDNIFGTILSAQYVGQLPKLKKSTSKNNWNVGEMF